MRFRSEVHSIVLHHSASSLATTLEEIRAWHTDPAKPGGPFDDVGYHFVVEGDGRTRVARPLMYTGAHARGHNEATVGICLVGDNTREARRWNASQITALRPLVESLRTVFGRPLPIFGHCDLSDGTACPGIDVAAQFGTFARP